VVALDDVTEDDVAATVRVGDLPYRVAITSFQQAVDATFRCSCRPMAAHNPCAHVYATLLAVDELLVSMAVEAPTAPAKALPRPRRAPAWQRRVQALALQQLTAPTPTLEYYVQLRPLDGESLLRIEIRERFVKKDGSRGVPRTTCIPAHVVDDLPEPDRTLALRAQRDQRSRWYGSHGVWRHHELNMAIPWDVAMLDAATVFPCSRARSGCSAPRRHAATRRRGRCRSTSTSRSLDLLEIQLHARKLTWERLDGSTRDRPRRIERFQTDAACSMFLISLKAGGYGLNLTAAHYVFLLDPWWNPAVEMQAIDRAHRIGQTRSVNAYRLVCRGTVEEHVLALQQRKKALCEAILGNERSRLQDLTRADLELLLG
jgi:hypothetical protein